VSSSEDSTRTVAAACLGTMCRCVDDELQLTTLLNSVILGIYSALHISFTFATITYTLPFCHICMTTTNQLQVWVQS